MVGHLTLLVDPGQQGDIVCKYPPRHPKSTKISGFFTFDNKTQCLYNRKKLTAQHCARNLAVSRPQKVWGLTFAGTWGEGRHPQVSFSALHLTFLKLETWFSLYSCFSIFSQRPLKISSFCGIWVWRYDLVLQVMSCPKWRIPNILRWLWALWAFDTLISAFFCQSYLPPIIEHVVLRCTDVRVRVKVNLGHLKLLRFRQAEFTFREVSLTVCLVKASQFMIKCNRDTQTDLCTHQYIHRHTQTYKHISLTLT